MNSCCDQPGIAAKAGDITVALAGNPNSGKTTIFNALTGMRQKVANYPGVTVEKKTGRFKLPTGQWVSVIDLPGTYSLISRSPDETVAMEVLRGLRADTPKPDAVIVVVDASNLQRNLYLVSQMIELGHPMVIALNMMDIAKRRGLNVSPERLAKQLGVPVVPIVGHKKQGVDVLKSTIVHAAIAPLPEWPMPEEMREQLMLVGGGLAILDSDPNAPAWPIAGFPPSPGTPGEGRGECSVATAEQLAHRDGTLTLPSPGIPGEGQTGDAFPRRALMVGETDDGRHLDRYRALAERLLIGDAASDLVALASRPAIASVRNHATVRLSELGIDPMQADIEAHYEWIEQVASASLEPACLALLQPSSGFRVPGAADASSTNAARNPILGYQSAIANLTDKADRILLHKVWGLAIFVLVMAGLFVSIFWLAAPVMDLLQGSVESIGVKIAGWTPPGAVHDLISDGIFKGVGSVIVFVPQIAILFFFLAVMEDTGYLARAAFLMDRLLSKVGLHGKSFIPMLSSFACAIPGIMATRTIENRKDRLATIFVAPFMSCSARLPVYTLLIGSFFASYGALAQGGIMLSLYLLGIIAAVGTAWVFKRSLLKGAPTSFILELPAYKVPQWGQVLRTVWTNTKAFLTKAGTTIFCLSVILWAMTYYPRLSDPAATDASLRNNIPANLYVAPPKRLPEYVNYENFHEIAAKQKAEAVDKYVEEGLAAEQLRHSIAGRLGHGIEPVIKPLGFDWKMGVGLVGAFAAREVFVSTMGIVYAAGDTEESTTPLQEQMKADHYADGRPTWTPLVAVSLLVWFVLAMQCMSTLAIVRRETGGWAWPIGMLVYMNAVAWLACFAVFQLGRIWFA
ncbi:hypothetical protein BH10PLA1_BH10PLA1_19580 [soil metagenome]